MGQSGVAITIASFTVPWVDVIGYAGAVVVVATFCMTTMLYLRVAALASNVLMFAFGFFTGMHPTMLVNLVLLPLNAFKLLQVLKLIGKVSEPASQDGLSFANLKPLMTRRRLPAGTTLIRKGDVADKLFYLDRGQLVIPQLNKTLEAGAVVGEIGVFSANKRRMATVVCLTDCELYELTESRTKELYFQNPGFGYAVMQLIIGRLLEALEPVGQQVSHVASDLAPPPSDLRIEPAPPLAVGLDEFEPATRVVGLKPANGMAQLPQQC